jgi:uncharacterized protein YjbI with pentapeptide repeats
MRNTTTITGTYERFVNATVSDLIVANQNITGCMYKNMEIKNTTFVNCDFQGTEITLTTFINCKFVNCNFSFSKFNNCSLIACKIENCNFCITNSLNCNFQSCTYINNICEESESMEVVFQEEEVSKNSKTSINLNNLEMTSMDILSSLSLDLGLAA